MAIDLDGLLLDRVFQPAADAASDWTSNFRLARFCLITAIVFYTAVLAWNLDMALTPIAAAPAVLATLAIFAGAQQMREQIIRAERQTRPGVMNTRRLTMRLFRWLLLWATMAAGAMLLLPDSDLGGVCVFVGNLAWLAAGHFVSCSPPPPCQRRFALAWARAR